MAGNRNAPDQIKTNQAKPPRDRRSETHPRPFDTRDLCGCRSPLLRPRGLHVKVTLCAQCPYTRRDLAGHYDPDAVLHLCANCDGGQKASTNEYPRKAERRQKCAAIPNILPPAQPSVARSAKANSASSGATPGGPRSVQRSALTASEPVRNVTADGYVGSNLLGHRATNSIS